MRNYFLEMYGTRSKEWRDGAKAAIDAFSWHNDVVTYKDGTWHKDGTRWIGSPAISIKEAYEMIDELKEE